MGTERLKAPVLLSILVVISLVVPATSFLGPTFVQANPENTIVIVILHTNDIHSHLLPEYGQGGSAYIASIVDNEREQHPGRVLLLDAGDIVDGDPVGDLFYGRSVIEVMNAMGYDAMTVGNHELGRYGGDYDYGVISIENDYLMDLEGVAEFPLLAANVLIDNSRPFESYVIKEIDNVKIGIIGATVYFPPPENVQILDYESVARECVEEIENQVDLIIALTHIGIGGDRSLASNVENIDIIIGGHSGGSMWEPENVGETKIVQAGAHGKYVGRIRLEFDAENHENYNFSYNLIEVNHPPLEENQGIAEMVENYDNIISPIVDVNIGYTENAIYRSKTGEKVAESFRENTGADVGYQNSGGIRASIPAGTIIIRQIHKVLPYGNKLMSMDLRGDYLKGQLGYGYVAGAYQEDSEWHLENGELIEDNEYYRVATNQYSGTRYGFVYGENILYHGLCRDAFIDYIKEAFYVLDISISPHENEGLLGEGVTFLVTVKNTGGIADNYLLENMDNSGWTLELENEVLRVPAGENRTTTLTVTISENAELGTEDNITVTATSTAYDTRGDSDSSVVHAISTKVEFSLANLYKVGLDAKLYLENGSKLAVKFYTYGDVFENENVFWSGTTPAHVTKFENVWHPENIGVQKVRLDLTTDDTENVISTIATFTVTRNILNSRLVGIYLEWPFASPERRSVLMSETVDIYLQWSFAPTYITEPLALDSDADGLEDGEEINYYLTNPLESDTDDDGLPDGLEVIILGSNPLRMDIFVEVDWMSTTLEPSAISRLIKEFADAPIENPNGSTGITLHIDLDEQVPAVNEVSRENKSGDWNDFWDYKEYYYSQREGFHYALICEVVKSYGKILGGYTLGYDFMVGTFRPDLYDGYYYPPDVVGAIFMHELGHAIGLHSSVYEGIDSYQVPFSDYLSVMNYNTPRVPTDTDNAFYGYSNEGEFSDWDYLQEHGLEAPTWGP